jgi:hypothetical protein
LLSHGKIRTIRAAGVIQRLFPFLARLSDQQAKGQSMTALPGTSDIDLFGYGKGVVDFDTKIAHRALDLLMS